MYDPPLLQFAGSYHLFGVIFSTLVLEFYRLSHDFWRHLACAVRQTRKKRWAIFEKNLNFRCSISWEMFPFWPFIPGLQRTDIFYPAGFLVKFEEYKFAARRRIALLIFHIKPSQCVRELWLGFTDKCKGKKVASRRYAGDKSSRNQCVRSKEDVSVFRYFMTSTSTCVLLRNSVIYKTSSQFYCSGKRHKTT